MCLLHDSLYIYFQRYLHQANIVMIRFFLRNSNIRVLQNALLYQHESFILLHNANSVKLTIKKNIRKKIV